MIARSVQLGAALVAGALLSCACCPAAATATAAGTGTCDLYVGPTGEDTNTGTSAAAPLRSLAGARDARRQRTRTTAAHTTICLLEGTYRMVQALQLTWQDSNTTWQGWQTDAATRSRSRAPTPTPAIVSGGIDLSLALWTPASKPDADGNQVWEYDVSSMPTAMLAPLRHLYVNGTRALRTIANGTRRGGTQKHSGAAWGNHGWASQPKKDVHFGCTGNDSSTLVLAPRSLADVVAAEAGNCSGPIRVSSRGFTITSPTWAKEALLWPDGGRWVEFVYSGVDPAPWAEARCGVIAVAAGKGACVRPLGRQACFPLLQQIGVRVTMV